MTDRSEDTEPTAASESGGGLARRTTTIAMFAGLVSAYGTLAAIMARYLYPSRPTPRTWTFVSSVREFGAGASYLFRTPAGQSINITRQGTGTGPDDFIALSSVCPHLGCQVHWEPQNDRYFCPCHNGAFAPDGSPTEGPPADAGQQLIAYPLKVERDLLFIELPQSAMASDGLTCEPPGGPPGPGHDPCLYTSRKA